MDITLNLNTNMMDSTSKKSNVSKSDKADSGFDSLMNIGNNTKEKTYVDKKIENKTDELGKEKNEIREPKENRLEDTKREKVKDPDKVSDSEDESAVDKLKELEEEIRNKKKKEDCASSEVLNMIMNTLTDENVNLDDYVIVNEDMTISIHNDKLESLLSDTKMIYEKEVGLNFDEVLENVTDILVGSDQENQDAKANDLGSEELMNMALDFIEDKINELLPKQIESNDVQIEVGQLVEELNENILDQNAEIVEVNDSVKVTDDEVLSEVKNIINELLGKTSNDNNEIKNKNKNLKIENEEALMNADVTTESSEEVKQIDATLNEESSSKEDSKSDIKEGKRENKDVKRININNNEVEYTLNNKNYEIKENFQKATITTVKENLASNFAENLNVVKQTISGISLSITETSSEMELKLNPENLGKINLKVATENGIVMAKFEAESQRVKEILEANLSLLKESLSEKGISVQSLEVSVGSNTSQDSSNYDYERNANKANNPHKIPRNGINKIVSIVDNNNRGRIRNTNYMIGNNVNYIA